MLYLLIYINEFRSFIYLFEIKFFFNMDNNIFFKYKIIFFIDCVGFNDFFNFFVNSCDIIFKLIICLLNFEIGIFKNGYKLNG